MEVHEAYHKQPALVLLYCIVTDWLNNLPSAPLYFSHACFELIQCYCKYQSKK